MLQQGIMLLTRFCQDNRVQINRPEQNLQIKFTHPVGAMNDFVAYIDKLRNSSRAISQPCGRRL